MRQKEGFALREVCGLKVLIAEGLGTVDFENLVNLNDTAAWIWEEAARQGDFTAESIAEALCKVYDVKSEVALKDATNLIAKWKEIGLLED